VWTDWTIRIRNSMFWLSTCKVGTDRKSMRQGLCNGTVSVRLSICLSELSAACGGFAAVDQADRRCRSIAARPAPSSNCAAAARRTAANASSVTFTAAVEGWTQFVIETQRRTLRAISACFSCRKPRFATTVCKRWKSINSKNGFVWNLALVTQIDCAKIQYTAVGRRFVIIVAKYTYGVWK